MPANNCQVRDLIQPENLTLDWFFVHGTGAPLVLKPRQGIGAPSAAWRGGIDRLLCPATGTSGKESIDQLINESI